MTTRWWLGRLARALLVLVFVTLLVSAMTAVIPGDPTLLILGPEATDDQRSALRSSLGLDIGFWQHYLMWMGGVLHGDFGTSFASDRPVASEIGTRLGVTLQLVLMAEVLALAVAVPLALYSGFRRGGVLDQVGSWASFLLLAVPSFVIGLVLIYLFSVVLGLLPASGYVAFASDPLGNVRMMVLPVLTLALAEAAVFTRVLRGSVVEALRQPFTFAAETRGATTSQLLWRTVLRPSSLPLITLVGINLGVSFGGTLLVETLFAVPGVGRLAISAIGSRDIPTIQGVVLVTALAVVVMTLLVDILQRCLDPRSAHVHH